MSLSFYDATDDIRDAAIEHHLPGSRKTLWATMVSQAAKQDSCDGSLVDMLLTIIQDYLKKPTDEEIVAMWLQTETGFGDDPETLYADCVRIDLQMELLAEATEIAWDEAREKKKKRKKSGRRHRKT